MNDSELIKLFKEYNRLDSDEDALLSEMLLQTKDYIIGAVGFCDTSMPRVRRLILSLMHDFYDQRGYATDKVREPSYTSKSLMLQLRAEGCDLDEH